MIQMLQRRLKINDKSINEKIENYSTSLSSFLTEIDDLRHKILFSEYSEDKFEQTPTLPVAL